MRISDWSSDVCSSDLFPEGKGRLIVETGGDSPSEARRQAERIANAMEGRCRASIVSDPADQHRVWTAREGGLGATAMVPDKPESWEGWEDSAVPREKLGDYLRVLRPVRSICSRQLKPSARIRLSSGASRTAGSRSEE